MEEFFRKKYIFKTQEEILKNHIKPLITIKPVNQGRVVCNSGYLVFCDSTSVSEILDSTDIMNDSDMRERKEPIVKIGNHFKINYNSERIRLPNIMQFNEDFVDFSNLWGDGMFAVLHSTRRNDFEVYVEAMPADITVELTIAAKNKDRKEKIEDKTFNLEGLVGVGGGRIAIVDPESYSITHLRYAGKHFDLHTVVKVPKGVYECRFVKTENEDGKISLIKAN